MSHIPAMPYAVAAQPARSSHLKKEVSLAEVLDRVLNTGAVVSGEIVISVAGIDLVYLGLNLLVCSVDTARGNGRKEGSGSGSDRHG